MGSYARRYRKILGRSWRLRCPRCGRSKLFAGWFRMRRKCPTCGLDFDREPGFYLGSIYINYGLTAVLMTIYFVSMTVADAADQQTLLWTAGAFCVVFPLCFFRFARSLWLGFDQFWDPQAPAKTPPAGVAPPEEQS